MKKGKLQLLESFYKKVGYQIGGKMINEDEMGGAHNFVDNPQEALNTIKNARELNYQEHGNVVKQIIGMFVDGRMQNTNTLAHVLGKMYKDDTLLFYVLKKINAKPNFANQVKQALELLKHHPSYQLYQQEFQGYLD